MNSHEVMKALVGHVRTLGWEIVEWSWKDESEGDHEYTVWLRESGPETVPEEAK